MANSDIQKLCDQLFEKGMAGNLYASLPGEDFMGPGTHQRSSFDFRWNKLELDCLSVEAQNKLSERVYQEHNRRTQVRISQEQERQRQKERAKQREKEKRIAPQKPVQQRFVSNKDNVEKYAHTIKSKNKNRSAAIRKALDNNFRITYRQYGLSSQVTKLLQQNNINAKQFQECVGNDIQQQIHQEFIDVLNNGADLYFSQEISPLTDQWYGVLSNVSFIGSSINNIGHFMLAHEIADLCEGLCQIEKRKISSCFDRSAADSFHIEELWSSALTCVGNALQKGGDKVVQFTEGVQQKAIGRPARFLTEWTCLLKNNPKEVFETAGSLLLDSVQYAFDSAQIVGALATDPFSENTFELVFDFGSTYVEPVGKKVTKAALIFWQMPAEEKAQEVVALGLQVFAVVGAAKLLAALPAQAALLKTAALLKLDKLSQMSGPVIKTGIAPDGTVNIALQAVEQMSEELVAVAEEAIAIAAGAQAKIATTAIADAVSTMVIAVRDGGSDLSVGKGVPEKRFFEKKTKIAREKTSKVRKKSIRPPEEIVREYKKLAGKEIEWQGSCDPAELKDVSTPKKIIFSEKALEHIFSGKVEKLPKNGPLKVSGYHSDFKGRAFSKSGMNMAKVRDPRTGVFEAKIRLCGKTREKTMFPENWKPKQVLETTYNAMENIFDIESGLNGRIIFRGKTSLGMVIEIITETNGEVVTFYPKLDGIYT